MALCRHGGRASEALLTKDGGRRFGVAPGAAVWPTTQRHGVARTGMACELCCIHALHA